MCSLRKFSNFQVASTSTKNQHLQDRVTLTELQIFNLGNHSDSANTLTGKDWGSRSQMEDKVEKDMAKEKILSVKSAPDDTEVKESKPLYRRRKCHLCCCLGVSLIVLMGIILLILVFAVFKAKDPDVRVNGVKLAHLNITYGTLVPRVRLMLDLNITVHNPNRAAFKYTNGSSMLYYQAIEVGRADIPAGRLGAGHTITEVVTLNVQAEKFLMGSNFTKDFAAGLIPVSATTRISGRVNVLNIYKHHAVSYSWCNMSVFIANATLANFQCRYTLHQ